MSECKTVRVHSDENVCLAVVETVSELTATEPLELAPLGKVVDTDAIETLFGASDTSRGIRHDAYLSFRYEGCDVTVDSDGTVSVTHTPAMTEPGSDRAFAPSADARSVAGSRGDADSR